jgi:hypothetical protein
LVTPLLLLLLLLPGAAWRGEESMDCAWTGKIEGFGFFFFLCLFFGTLALYCFFIKKEEKSNAHRHIAINLELGLDVIVVDERVWYQTQLKWSVHVLQSATEMEVSP